MSNWTKNPGYMVPLFGELVDVRYRNGSENFHIRAGWPNNGGGSASPCNASDWEIDNSEMDILEWRIHDGMEDEQSPESISSEIKQTNINILCEKILEQEEIALRWLVGEEPSEEEQETVIRLDREIIALAKGMINK